MGFPATRRLHMADSYLYEFEAEVLGARPSGAEVGVVEVALDQTAFYAASGGQPDDAGTLAGGDLRGLTVEDGVVWHRLAASRALPEVGDRVRGAVDARRRLDHMRQHTGQHLLSAAALRSGLGETVSFHLGREECTIDLEGAEPSFERVRDTLALAHACILEDRPIHVHQTGRAELARFPLRRDPTVEADVLRVIEIEGFDWSLCGGTHARRSGEIGPLHVLGWEKQRGRWRLRFVAGERALELLAREHATLDRMARAESVHWSRVEESLEGWRAEARELQKEAQRLREELGRRRGEALHRATTPDLTGVRIAADWLGAVSLGEARAVATRFVESGPAAILVGARPESGKVAWIVARSEAWPDAAGGSPAFRANDALRAWLAEQGGKGGGTETFAQGASNDESGLADDDRMRALAHWVELKRVS